MITRITGALVICMAAAYFPAYALKFVAYGDTRDNPTVHTTVINRLAAENPELILHVGDLSGTDANIPTFTAVIAGNTITNALWQANIFLVARGNHESWTALRNISPTMVRNNSETYSFTQGNCFFVSMGFDPGANITWLQTQLGSPAARAAAWRIIWHHKPIYSTGTSHGADGNTSEGSNVVPFRAACDTFKVTICFSGHDHIYERSHLIYKGAVTDNTNNIPASKRGTVYVVTGGGAAPLAGIAATNPWWRHFGVVSYEYCLIDAGNDSLVCTTKQSNGTVIDQFVIHRNTTAVNPRPSNRETYDKALGIRSLGKNMFAVTAPAGTLCAIYDVSGRAVLQKRISASRERINLSRMNQGLYIARIASSGQTAVQKLVIW